MNPQTLPAIMVAEEREMALPRHVGIIMDGNGRWATARGLGRGKGHLEGLEAARRITQATSEAGIPYLSLYVFSTENWKRSVEEVGFLMSLVSLHLEREIGFYREHNLRVVHSGDRSGLPSAVRRSLGRIVDLTASHRGMVVNLALNHGGRDEILRAVARWASEKIEEPLTEERLRQHLDRPELPDLDLLIRTGGELRLSNFLLWQAAYAELVFSPKLWPDFGVADLRAALSEYEGRERRFGAAAVAVRARIA
jgi:undecaprenyl diphosphate synthase